MRRTSVMPRSPGQGSLFERLDPDVPPRRSRTRQALAAERIGAIKRQLEWILNTRRGSAQSCPELGLRDFNDTTVASDGLREQACEEIRTVIGAFEPRVRVAEVFALPSSELPLDLRFRLVCVVPANDEEDRVEIDLIVQGRSRRIKVA
jgi:type VI secretion system protein